MYFLLGTLVLILNIRTMAVEAKVLNVTVIPKKYCFLHTYSYLDSSNLMASYSKLVCIPMYYNVITVG